MNKTDEEILELFYAKDQSEVTEFKEKYGTLCQSIALNKPIKTVELVKGIKAFYVDSYPELPQPKYELDDRYFTPMTTEELFEYYNYSKEISEIIGDNGLFTEVTDENTRHGIYTFSDGSVYDVNIFTFESAVHNGHLADRFTITLSKEMFGQQYIKYFKNAVSPSLLGFSIWYNEGDDTPFLVDRIKDTMFMISATVDEMIDSDNSDREYIEKQIAENGRCCYEVADMMWTTSYKFNIFYNHYGSE